MKMRVDLLTQPSYYEPGTVGPICLVAYKDKWLRRIVPAIFEGVVGIGYDLSKDSIESCAQGSFHLL